MARIARPMTSDFTKNYNTAAGLPSNHGMTLRPQGNEFTPDKYNSNANLFTVTERKGSILRPQTAGNYNTQTHGSANRQNFHGYSRSELAGGAP